MSITFLIIGFLAGWCGTPWPKRWPIPWPPVPKPDPPPCWICGNFASGIAGVFTAFLVMNFIPEEVDLATISITSFIGGRLGGDLYNAIKKQQ